MAEVLGLEEAWALVRRLYARKTEGWRAYEGITKNGLLDLVLSGPDNVIEIVQDSPGIFMVEAMAKQMRQMPKAWKPLGKGAILDEDVESVRNMTEFREGMPYGLRPVSRAAFVRYMRLLNMARRGESMEIISRAYHKMVERHARVPVAAYNEIDTPIVSTGVVTAGLDLADISSAQRQLRQKLENDVRKMQQGRTSYIG